MADWRDWGYVTGGAAGRNWQPPVATGALHCVWSVKLCTSAIMHFALYISAQRDGFDHVQGPRDGPAWQLAIAMQTNGLRADLGWVWVGFWTGLGRSLTKGDAIRLLLLVLVFLLIALFAAQRLQLDAICGGHFVVPFRHVATTEATT